MIEPFQSAIPIIKMIESHGYEAYFVGGSVRDYLLHREIADVDIATSATPNEIKRIFHNTVDLGIEHGTVLVLYKGIGYEITTFRVETEYKDFRHPEQVRFVRSLYKDLERRDFTMNAMAMKYDGEIIDPFLGRNAIVEKVIQTVGQARDRFHEDALRMMRAIRFVSQLNFRLHPDTKSAVQQMSTLLQYIAIERITTEFTKLLNGSNKEYAFQLLVSTELGRMLPGNSEKIFQECINYRINPLSENQLWLLLLYFNKNSKPNDYLKEWRLPAKKIKYLSKAWHCLQERMMANWNVVSLFHATEELAIDVEIVFHTLKHLPIDKIRENLSETFKNMVITNKNELKVTGNDLMEWFNRTSGPWIKEMLSTIEKGVLHKQVINEKESIRRWVLTCSHQHEKDY